MKFFVTQITLQNTTIIKTINKTHLHKPTSVTESVKNQTSFSPILFLTRNPWSQFLSKNFNFFLKHTSKVKSKNLFHINNKSNRMKTTWIVPFSISFKVSGFCSKPPQQNHRNNTVFVSTVKTFISVFQSWVPNNTSWLWIWGKGVVESVIGYWKVEIFRRCEWREESMTMRIRIWRNGWVRKTSESWWDFEWFLKRVVVVMVWRENGCGGFGFWG